jgi:hypothetical protein
VKLLSRVTVGFSRIWLHEICWKLAISWRVALLHRVNKFEIRLFLCSCKETKYQTVHCALGLRSATALQQQVYIRGKWSRMMSSIFWDMTPCSSLKVSRSFWGIFCFNFQDRTINEVRDQHEAVTELKMESTYSSETSADFQWTTRRYIPEDTTHHKHRYGNLRSYAMITNFKTWNSKELYFIEAQLPTLDTVYFSSHEVTCSLMELQGRSGTGRGHFRHYPWLGVEFPW